MVGGILVSMVTTHGSPLEGIGLTFARWGVPYRNQDIVKGRPGEWSPLAVMVHHDAVRGPAGASARVARIGRVGGVHPVPGPLYQFIIRRDLTVDIVTLGRANHAGEGRAVRRILKDKGNRLSIGVCFEHAGTAAEVWPVELTRFGELVVCAVCDHLGLSARDVLGHKEYTTRKIDPYALDMTRFRAQVGLLLDAGPPPQDQDDDQEDDDMKTTDKLRIGPTNAVVLKQTEDREATVGETLIGTWAAVERTAQLLEELIGTQAEVAAQLKRGNDLAQQIVAGAATRPAAAAGEDL